MATHSSTLAWRIPWTQEPGGLLSTGSHRVGHDWSDLAASWFSTSLPVSSVPLQLTFHPMCLMEPKLCLDHSYVSVLSGAGKNHQTVNIIATKCYDHQPQFPMLYDSKFSRHFSHYSTVISPFFFLSSFCLDNTPQFKTKVTCFSGFLGYLKKIKKKRKNSKKHLSTILPKYHFPFPILVCLYPIPHQMSLRRH